MLNESIFRLQRVIVTDEFVSKGLPPITAYGYEVGTWVEGKWVVLVLSPIIWPNAEGAEKHADKALAAASRALSRFKLKRLMRDATFLNAHDEGGNDAS